MLRSACAYAQSDQSLCWSLECSMSVKLLSEHHLEFLSLKGGCRGPSESTLVKMSHCWKSQAAAQLYDIWHYILQIQKDNPSSPHSTGFPVYNMAKTSGK